jgi:photosynthetic reaction center cytochrome c subunit
MNSNMGIRGAVGALAAVVGALLTVALFLSWERPPVVSVQHGFRGTGQILVFNPRTLASQAGLNALPDPIEPVEAAGTPSSSVYQNVQVLKTVDSSEFLRVMAAITAWVSPDQSCNYCHNPENLAEDSVYTKVVARRMLQMVQYINSNWKNHVGATGVTCYTCHRGQPVPAQVWFTSPAPPHAGGVAESDTGKNVVSKAAGGTALPYDPFTPFLLNDVNIRVQSTTALPSGDDSSIKETDWTYALMINMSQSLGVNCDYCHNTRAFSSWEQSHPQRVTAWYGIRMVRALNNDYLVPLTKTFPAYRLGQLGDVAKVNCATCHQGAYKPLYGASMVQSFPELMAATDGSVPPPAVPK